MKDEGSGMGQGETSDHYAQLDTKSKSQTEMNKSLSNYLQNVIYEIL